MLRPQLVIDPPSWATRTFQPAQEPPRKGAVRLPSARYYTVTGTETLAGLAERYYGNPLEAQRIFNANRLGALRDDRVMGFLRTPSDPLTAGMILLIP